MSGRMSREVHAALWDHLNHGMKIMHAAALHGVDRRSVMRAKRRWEQASPELQAKMLSPLTTRPILPGAVIGPAAD